MSEDGGGLIGLSEERLLEFVQHEGWFGAKSQEANAANMIDHAVLREEPRLSDELGEIRYRTGNRDIYQLLLGDGECDMLADPALAHALVRLVREGARLPTTEGHLEFESFGALPEDSALENVHVLGVEQSNSSLVLGD